MLISLLHAVQRRMNRMLQRLERRAPVTANTDVSRDARSDASDSLATGAQVLDGEAQDLRLFPGQPSAGPPAHWLEFVQRRAPGLLDSLAHRNVAPPAGLSGADGERPTSPAPTESALDGVEWEASPGTTDPVDGWSQSAAQAVPGDSHKRPAKREPTPQLRSAAKQRASDGQGESATLSDTALRSVRPGETLHTAGASEHPPRPDQETAAEMGSPHEKGPVHEPQPPAGTETRPVKPPASPGEEAPGRVARSRAHDSRLQPPPIHSGGAMTTGATPAIEDRRRLSKLAEPIGHRQRRRPAAETPLEGAAPAGDFRSDWVVPGEDRAPPNERDRGTGDGLVLNPSGRAAPLDRYAALEELQALVGERPFILSSQGAADGHSSRAAPPASSHRPALLPPRTITRERGYAGEPEPRGRVRSWPTLPDESAIPDATTVRGTDERWPSLPEPSSQGMPIGGIAGDHGASAATLRRAEYRRQLDLEQRGMPWNG